MFVVFHESGVRYHHPLCGGEVLLLVVVAVVENDEQTVLEESSHVHVTFLQLHNSDRKKQFFIIVQLHQ